MSPRTRIDQLLITFEDAAKLSLEHRMALGASVCHAVIRLYSSYFQITYRQSDACDIAWRIAGGAEVIPSEYKALAKIIERLMDQAEEEGYAQEQLAMGGYLMFELLKKNGKNVALSIESAATSLAYHNLYAQGIDLQSDQIEGKYVDQLTIPVYELARSIYEKLLRYKNEYVTSDFVSGLELDRKYVTLSKSVISRIDARPPLHERVTY